MKFCVQYGTYKLYSDTKQQAFPAVIGRRFVGFRDKILGGFDMIYGVVIGSDEAFGGYGALEDRKPRERASMRLEECGTKETL